MTHAPVTHPADTRNPLHRRRRPATTRGEGLHRELRDVLAAVHHLDPERLRAASGEPVRVGAGFDLLGAAPVRTGAEALARLDALAHELVDRMREGGWDEGAAPAAVTSVLAASVPEAEAVLLRAARSRHR